MVDNELEKVIGTQERVKLSAGTLTVKKVTVEPAKEGSKAKLAKLWCKHPDKEELISISNIKIKKIQGDNETIMKDALWWNLDDAGNLRKDSTIAHLLRFYKKNNLNAFIETQITTEHDSSDYLCVKAY